MWGATQDEAERMAAEQIPDAGASVKADVFLIWPENVTSLSVFLACSTQWRYGATGGCLGMDYPALECAMRMMDVKDAPAVFRDVRIMEGAALEVLNDRSQPGAG